MSFWDRIEKDVRNGIDVVRNGGTAVSRKLEKLTAEGKRKYKIYTLNVKVQDECARLGSRVYELNIRNKDPMADRTVLSLLKRIQKLDEKADALKKRSRRKKSVKRSTGRVRKKTAPSRKTGRPRKKGRTRS